MLGTLVNIVAIICGSLVGFFLKKGLPENIKMLTMQAIGLGVLLVGMKMSLESENLVIVLLSMAFGAGLGEAIGIEIHLERFGEWLEKKVRKNEDDNGNSIATGFVAATLLYCVGAMAITGSIQSGLTGDHSILYAKSVLDGVSAVLLTATLGIGVIFSAFSVFVYQGTITILAGAVQEIITPIMITEITATGGLLIFAIGLNLLEITKIKVGNLLPALVLVVLFLKLGKLMGLL